MVDMPRLETYVDDRVYVRILQYKAENHIKTNGKAANEILHLYFQLIESQDKAIDRFSKALAMKDSQINEYENHIKHLEMKLKKDVKQ